jgi:hypothetical protein
MTLPINCATSSEKPEAQAKFGTSKATPVITTNQNQNLLDKKFFFIVFIVKNLCIYIKINLDK